MCQTARSDLSYLDKLAGPDRHPLKYTLVFCLKTLMPFMPRPSTAGGARGIANIEFPSISRAMALGITFAVAGNVLISFSLNLQKLAHAQLEAARAERGHGLDLIEEEGTASSDGEASEADVQREPGLPPELESEARVWNGNSDPILHLGPCSETDPLIALTVTPDAEQIIAVPTYGALSPNTSVESSPLRRRPKIAERLGTGVADNYANQPTYQRSNYEAQESEYLKSKLWYALPISLLPPGPEAEISPRWLGFLLMNVGETGNFISYAFAPASVVAPLGTVNVFSAPLRT